MLLWDGACIVHEAFSFDKLLELYRQHPTAKIVAHPESESHILEIANFTGSTSAMLNYVKKSDHHTFIVATEAGILHQMQKEVSHKTLLPAPAKEDNTCACSECAFMKMNTLQKLYNCLKNENPEIILPADIMNRALAPIEKMLQIS